uniref:Uncharacterized protein n=1 Tax=Arundo donax TaxID=35708 RepID=A0A0A9ASQ4_ARUDO
MSVMGPRFSGNQNEVQGNLHDHTSVRTSARLNPAHREPNGRIPAKTIRIRKPAKRG